MPRVVTTCYFNVAIIFTLDVVSFARIIDVIERNTLGGIDLKNFIWNYFNEKLNIIRDLRILIGYCDFNSVRIVLF